MSAMAEGDLEWYAIRVRSNYEKTVSRLLQQKGYNEFLPTYEQASRWSDRVTQITRPFFPGYVFCQFGITKRMPILTTPGVVSIVGFGKIPAAIDPQEIAAVQRLVESGLATVPWPYCRVGQRVVIEEGPLVGVEGTVLEVRNAFRLVVSISLLQRSVSAEIDRVWIRPMSERQSFVPQAVDNRL